MNNAIKHEAMEIFAICKKYGCGNVMEWVSAFNRHEHKKSGLPAKHAFISVIEALCDENDEGVKVGRATRELYDKMVQDIMGGDAE